MTEGRAGATAARRVGSGASRIVRAWRVLPHERRLAAYAAVGLFLTLFLPWYQETVFVASSSGKLQGVSQSLTGWGAFSFVEAAVLLVGVGVLTLLLQRAEGRAFHIPGGDGGVITAAGLWTCVLVVWRIFDKQGTNNHGQILNSSGIEWGIFVALAGAAFLTYAGTRIRAAHQPEPPLPGEQGPSDGGPDPLGAESGPPAAARRESGPPAAARRESSPPATRRRTSGAPAAAQSEPGPSAAAQHEASPPADAQRQSGPPAAARRERVRPAPERAPGWLTAPPGPSADVDPPEFPYPARRPVRPPKPVPAEDPPTARARSNPDPDPDSNPDPANPPDPDLDPDAPLPPSTAAARRHKQSDDQLTMPLEREE